MKHCPFCPWAAAKTCLAILLASVLFGCGGGSSATPKTSAGAAIAVTFGGTFAPVAVASQIGTDAWSTATLQAGTLNLTLPHGTTNYGIASCVVREHTPWSM